LFEERAVPGATGSLSLFGSADAAHTVLRLNRRSVMGRCELAGDSPGRPSGKACLSDGECGAPDARCRRFLVCRGGIDGGLPCSGDPADEAQCQGGACETARCSSTGLLCDSDAACPGATCGPVLFDFASRQVARQGPVVVSDVHAKALDPVPLDG